MNTFRIIVTMVNEDVITSDPIDGYNLSYHRSELDDLNNLSSITLMIGEFPIIINPAHVIHIRFVEEE